jgi:hypothetical protein
MGTTKYNEEDVILLSVIVLDISAFFYGGIAFKFAVKDHYQDLRGKVLSDVLDDSGADLLDVLDDGLIIMISHQVNLIVDAYTNICNVYNLTPFDQKSEEGVAALAEDLYWQLMDDQFPCDDEADEYDDAEYLDHLGIYIMSLIRIVKSLTKIIIDCEINLEDAAENVDFFEPFEPKDYSDQVHAYALGVLCKLGVQLNEHQQRVYHYYLTKDEIK